MLSVAASSTFAPASVQIVFFHVPDHWQATHKKVQGASDDRKMCCCLPFVVCPPAQLSEELTGVT